MIIKRLLLSDLALQDDCLLVYCAVVWRGKHMCLYACVQSLFLQKDFYRFVINPIALE